MLKAQSVKGRTPALMAHLRRLVGDALGRLPAVSPPVGDPLRIAYRSSTDEAIAQRAPLAAALFILFIGIGTAFQFLDHPDRWPVALSLYAVEILLCAVHVATIRRYPHLALPLSIGVTIVLSWCLNAYFATIGQNSELLVVALILVLTGFQVVYPWGLIGQGLTSGGTVLGLLAAHLGGAGGSLSWPNAFFGVTTAAVLTTLGADLLDRHRFDAFRRTAQLQTANAIQREAAETSAALLRISEVLDALLMDTVAMIERLTETTRAVLGTDWAILYLWDKTRRAYRVASVSAPEQDLFEEIGTVEFTRDALPFTRTLESEGLIEIADRDAQSLIPPDLLERWRVRSMLSALIRRGGEPVGSISVGYNERRGPFTPPQIRLLTGIARQAAVAVENARLMETTREANRVKSEFVATMSHELRTPLNVILGYIDLFDEGHLGTTCTEQRDALGRMRTRGAQLLELINGTLDLNRLEAGRAPVVLEHFSTHELIGALRENIPRSWFKEGVQLTWENACASVIMRSDRTKVETALRNLIHNALKFTEQGQVSVHVHQAVEARALNFRVTDTGVGIAPEQLPYIFDMFHQASRVHTNGGGVGLGLHIAKRFAASLGGTIFVESRAGVGSEFTLRLPVEAPATPSLS